MNESPFTNFFVGLGWSVIRVYVVWFISHFYVELGVFLTVMVLQLEYNWIH